MKNSKRTCLFTKANATAVITDWKAVPEDMNQIQAYLYEHGPLSVLINAGSFLQFYHSGIYEPADWLCDPSELDHAVLLVGWGQKKDIIGTIKEYWIVKVSYTVRR